MKQIVYKLTFPNNKIYIGTTKRNLERRINNGYKHNEEMTNAIIEFGWKNIKKEILFECENENEAFDKEIELIKEYKSNNSLYGYNISSGGKSGKKETKMSQENKNLLLQRLKGNDFHLGKKHSIETKNKISLLHKGKHRSRETEFPSRKVKCIETQIIYNSLSNAQRETGINHSHISQVCNKLRKTAGGLHWEYIGG